MKALEELTVEKLKKISHEWVNGRRRIVKEGIPYMISVDFIEENLYYTRLVMQNNDDEYSYSSDEFTSREYNDGNLTYEDVYNDIKENGWDTNNPGKIFIGPIGEIYYGQGNHRLNMVINSMPDIKKIPVNIIYSFRESVYMYNLLLGKYDPKGGPNDLGIYKAGSKFPKWNKTEKQKNNE